MSDVSSLRIMPREMRMMAERILSLTQLSKGVFMTMPDHVMFSQALGLGGFTMLAAEFETLKTADPRALSIAGENASTLTLDCGGQHAWVAAASIIDLLGELTAAHGGATVNCTDLREAEELAIVVPLARRCGLDVAVEGTSLAARPLVLTGEPAKDEPLLWRLLLEGTRIDAGLWWRIYAMAGKALAPDTIVSRRHAGPMIVNDDGTVVGRKDNDDETDIAFLVSAGAAPIREGDNKP